MKILISIIVRNSLKMLVIIVTKLQLQKQQKNKGVQVLYSVIMPARYCGPGHTATGCFSIQSVTPFAAITDQNMTVTSFSYSDCLFKSQRILDKNNVRED